MFTPRSVAAFSIALAGILLAVLSVVASPQRFQKRADATSSGPPISWAMAPSPDIGDHNFSGVTCVSSSDCWAVGTFVDATFTNQTLIEHWNGTSWSIVAGGSIDMTQDNSLNAVACSSSSDCWAVGYQGTNVGQTLIEHWNGSAWSVISSPNSSTSQKNSLSAVFCSSSTDCWAVGSHSTATVNQTLIERWNGVSWSIVSSPNSSTVQGNFLNSVTCTSSTNCWAAGSHDGGSASLQQTLIERWNGTSWSIVSTPNATITATNALNGIACASATECSAVGYYVNNTGFFQNLILRWTGSSWAIVTSPNTSTSQNNFLFGVTCTATTNCWAVGSGNDQSLVERWNGSTWSLVVSPNTASTLNRFQAVTCTSLSDCWAAGFAGNSFDQALTEHWNGTAWSVVPNADILNSDTSNALTNITCLTSTDCWAIGNFVDPGSGASQNLITHWDGSKWAIITAPDTDAQQTNSLEGITCVSTTNCWAVGSYNNANGVFQTLIVHWDGSLWSIIPSPSTLVTQDNILNQVSCTSTSQCWAVGYYINDSNVEQTLIERWNGVSWSIVSSPNLSASQSNQLNAITCAAANDCWAVGDASNGTALQTLLAHWNGINWSSVTSPNTSASEDNFLNDVTCSSSADCWAVGAFGSLGQTLILRWNGSFWLMVSSPNSSPSEMNSLNAVACASRFDCTAVGIHSNGTVQQTLIERWNGIAWTLQSSPNNGPTNFLVGVACVSNSDCWTVGSYQVGSTSQTLIERRSVIAPVSLASVSRPSTGHFILSGQAAPGAMVNIFASQNMLTNFTLLASPTADVNGTFQYDDASAATISPPRRFYQVVYP